jgi:hypothetical protein
MVNGSIRMEDVSGLSAQGTIAPGTQAQAGGTGTAAGGGGWWDMGQPPLPGRGWRCTLPLLTNALGRGVRPVKGLNCMKLVHPRGYGPTRQSGALEQGTVW